MGQAYKTYDKVKRTVFFFFFGGGGGGGGGGGVCVCVWNLIFLLVYVREGEEEKRASKLSFNDIRSFIS